MSKMRNRKRARHHEDITIGMAVSPVSALSLNRLPTATTATSVRVAPAPIATAVSAPRPASTLQQISTAPAKLTPTSASSALAAAAGGSAIHQAAVDAQKAALSAANAQKVSNAAARVSSATSRLRAAANKNKKLRGKLTAIANTLDKKAASAKAQAKAVSQSVVMGVDWQQVATQQVDSNALMRAVTQLIAQGSEADAISVASDINQEMGDDVSQLQGLTQTDQVAAALRQATDFGNTAYDIVSSYDPAQGDSSISTRVAALQSQVSSWNSSSLYPTLRVALPQSTAPAASTPAPQPTGPGTFDPGTAGGGGGGGTDWDGGDGQSSAVQDFRERGVDPFADEDDGSVPVVPEGGGGTDDADWGDDGEGGYAPDGSYADEARALLEENEGEASDPEGDDLFSEVSDDQRGALDSVEGDFDWGTEWAQIFYNPAGIALDAMNQPSRAAFQTRVATPSTTGRWRASSAAQQNLTASQQRLAQAKAALAANRTAYLQQLMASTGQSAPLPQVAPEASTSLSRYSPSGAFVGPTAGSPTVPAPPPSDTGGTMYQDDPSALSTDSVEGLTPDEVETVCCGVEALTGTDLSDELQDLIVDSFDHQITDARSDFTRGPAARHGGAAYLDPRYPRGGSVAGRQGGLIQPEEMIIVGNKDVFFGGCYEHGLDVLGAAVGVPKLNAIPRSPGKPVGRAGFVQKTTPRGRSFLSLQVLNPKHHDHTASIKNARDAGKRAMSVADKVDKQVKNAAMAVHKTAVRGDLIGASAAVARGVVKHLLTSAQLIKATKSARDLGQKAVKAADKHEKGIATLNAKNKSGAAAARSKLKMGSSGKASVIHGIDDEAADLYLDAAVDTIFGACTPDPNDPGWCTDGTIDPNYAAAGLPPGAVAPSATPSSDAMPGPPDYGLGPAPTAQSVEPKEGVDYVADPFPGADGDVNQYSSDPSTPGTPLPIGAVIYDGSTAPGYLSLGSYTTFYGAMPGGAPAEGGSGPVMPPGGSYASGGSGYQWHDDGWYSFRKNDYAGPAGSGDYRLQKADDSGASTGPARAANSMRYNWGPMIGNPNSQFKGLRYDVAGNQWFWYYDAAPNWAKAPIRQALINQAILDYQAQLAAAAADYASQMAADRLAAEQAKQLQAQQAIEDSQMQHQMDLESKQVQSAASTQALADEAAARQQQAQDESYARQAQAEASAQAQLEQSEALTQAKIEQQELETLARLAAQEQAAQQVADMQSPSADAGDSPFVPDDGSSDDDGAPYDGYAAAKESLDTDG